MRADQLPRATKLVADLKLWREALARCDHGRFKEAHIRVVDAAHGQPGIPGPHGNPGQSGETVVMLDAEHVRPIAEHHIKRLMGELREMGVEV